MSKLRSREASLERNPNERTTRPCHDGAGRASDAILGLSPKVAELVVDIKRFRFVIFEHCGRI